MILHEHLEAKYCRCSVTALEPNENCPIHGNPWPPRCMICGQFMKWTRFKDLEQTVQYIEKGLKNV